MLGMLLAAVGLGTCWAVTFAGKDLATFVLQRSGMSEAFVPRVRQCGLYVRNDRHRGRDAGLRPRLREVGKALFVRPVPDAGAGRRADHLLLRVRLYLAFGAHAGLRVLHAGHPCRVRDLLSRVVPQPPAFHRCGLLLQRRAVARGADAGLVGLAEAQPGISLPWAITLMNLLFVGGILLVFVLPETKGQPLPK